MKRGFILIFILLMVNLTSAIELNVKSDFDQGETFYATLNGNIENILTSENIIFYRGNTEVPVDVSFLKFGDNYYISGQLIGKQPGNYSVELKDLKYYELRELKTLSIKSNFTISNNIADFLIATPLIETKNNFKISLENPTSSSVLIDIDSELNSESQVEIASAETKDIDFEVSSFNNSTLQFINLSSEKTSYNVPVYIISEIKPEVIHFDIEPEEMNISMSTNVSFNYSRIIWIKNNGNVLLENITFNLSDSIKDYASLPISFVEELDENQTFAVGVFFQPKDKQQIIEGKITINVQSHKINLSLPVLLDISASYMPIENDAEVNQMNLSSIQHCNQLNGFICNSNQTCTGEMKNSWEGNCCVGLCKEKTSSGLDTKIIGWVLIILILGFVVWFYFKKYKKVKPSIDLVKESKPKRIHLEEN